MILPDTDKISKLVMDKIKSKMNIDLNNVNKSDKKKKPKKKTKKVEVKPKEEEKKEIRINPLDMNIWKIKEEFLTDDIMNNIKKNTNNIRILTEVLSDEEKHDKKKKIKNYQSFDGLGKRGKNKDSKISKNVKKIMSDVGKLVLDMKTISENSYKENIKSLRKTTNEIKKTEIGLLQSIL